LEARKENCPKTALKKKHGWGGILWGRGKSPRQIRQSSEKKAQSHGGRFGGGNQKNTDNLVLRFERKYEAGEKPGKQEEKDPQLHANLWKRGRRADPANAIWGQTKESAGERNREKFEIAKGKRVRLGGSAQVLKGRLKDGKKGGDEEVLTKTCPETGRKKQAGGGPRLPDGASPAIGTL